jgi:hypothetical protein
MLPAEVPAASVAENTDAGGTGRLAGALEDEYSGFILQACFHGVGSRLA